MSTSISLPQRSRRACWLFLALALAVFLTAACDRYTAPNVPDHLIGVWKTDHPNYRDLFLEITEQSVSFSTTEGGVESYVIANTENSTTGKTSSHVIHGERSGENLKFQFQFYYEPSGGGRLRFKNQLQVAWSKVSDARQ